MSPVSLPLRSAPGADGGPRPRWPHTSKQAGIVALGFQTNITHFLCCPGDGGRGGGHSGLSPEDLPHPTLSPSTGPLPHPTGAAKSNCQSRRRCCIPLKGQLVAATEGFAAVKCPTVCKSLCQMTFGVFICRVIVCITAHRPLL